MPLHIRLLGGFQIRNATGDPVAIQQPRLQMLAGYLLLHANQPVLRGQLAFLFWPDSSEKQARTNLRKLLHTLRNLDTHIAAALDLSSETVCWRLASASHLDLATFAEHLRDAAQATDPATRLQHLTSALEAYGGEFLPGHYEEWVLVEREELRLRYVNALEELVARHETAGDVPSALQAAQRLVQADPLQERAYRLVMGLYLELGEPAAALRTYHACTRLLGEELDVEPSPETQAFHARILRAEAQTTPHTTATAAAPANHQPQHYPSERATRAAFVGRRSEWHTLRRLWQTIARRGPQLVVIRGEAGIGKTRLAEELADTARKQGHVTLYARAYAAEGRTAYGPVADLLRDGQTPAALHGLESHMQSELARILPELGRESGSATTPLSEAWQQRRFHEALVRGCLAQGSPLLIHLDDLQWFDAETLSWLHFLLRYDTTTPLLVVGTLRSGEIGPEHPYHDLHHALIQTGSLHEIALDPLSADSVAAMATHIAGAALPEAANAALFQSTEGNPLFVLETLQALRSAGTDTSANTPGDIVTDIATDIGTDISMDIAAALLRVQQGAILTPRVQAVIQARLAQLSQSARQVIRLAAVIGRHFTYELLQTISGTDATGGAAADAQTGTLDLVNALDELWQRRIIREHGVNAYDFSHDRIREVVYAEISPVLRPHLHAQVATTLERLHAAELGAAASQIAMHLAAAGRPTQAATYYTQAAHYAYERFAHQDAIAQAQRALELTPAHDLLARFEICDLQEEIYLLTTARSGERFANLQQMGELADKLYAQAQESGADSAQMRAAVARRAHVKTLLGSYYSASGQVQRAIRTAQEAVDLAQTVEALPELARALLCLGYSGYWVAGNMAAARRELLRAVELAQSLGMDELEAICLEQLAASGMFSGMSAHDILNNLMRALSIHEKNNNLYRQSGILGKLGYIVMAQGEGDYTPVLEHYAHALEFARRIGYEFKECETTDNLGIMNVAHGDYAQAEYWLQECRRLSKKINFLLYIAVNQSFLSYLRANQGRLGEAVEFGRASVALFAEPGIQHRATESYSMLGYAEFLRGDLAAAHEHLQHALHLARSNGDRRFEATAQVRLGHVHLAQNRLADARPAFEQSYKLRQSLQQYRRSLEPLAGLAQVAWRENRHDDALDLATQIYTELQETTLEFTEEALQVYVICHQIFCADADPRADDVYNWACDHLARRAATLPADERPAFDALPLHRALRAEYQPILS